MSKEKERIEPKVVPVKLPICKNGLPELIDLHFDLWILKITLSFPNEDFPTYVVFDNITGFRLLDEGDLIEFWNPKVRSESWIWEIESGGWFELEKNRSEFVSGNRLDLKEFFIPGVNKCINVISNKVPEAYEPMH